MGLKRLANSLGLRTSKIRARTRNVYTLTISGEDWHINPHITLPYKRAPNAPLTFDPAIFNFDMIPAAAPAAAGGTVTLTVAGGDRLVITEGFSITAL